MIKIEPLYPFDYVQARALLQHQDEPVPAEHSCSESALFFRGIAFWQHWLPCKMHIAPSVYVAKEDGNLVALITLRPVGKSKLSWQVEHLVVHKEHRGRGIAQELLKYAFAVLGSQGVSHFSSEVSDQNTAALALFKSCGFRRCAKVAHYRQDITDGSDQGKGKSLRESLQNSGFRLAVPDDRHPLFQLFQESLPSDIRLILQYCSRDFSVPDLPVDRLDRLGSQLASRNYWYLISEDPERHVLTSAVKVTVHEDNDYHFDFAIHPGWTAMANDLAATVTACVGQLTNKGVIHAKAYDWQKGLDKVLEDNSMERTGGFCLLTREHWVRAKKPSLEAVDRSIPSIPNAAINLPRSAP